MTKEEIINLMWGKGVLKSLCVKIIQQLNPQVSDEVHSHIFNRVWKPVIEEVEVLVRMPIGWQIKESND